MGYNTTVVVMNDALDAIANDPKFGEKLKSAILGISLGINPKTGEHYRSQDVSACGHVNAATVIETHHADMKALVAVGGNYGHQLGNLSFGDPSTLEGRIGLLRQFASDLGYEIRRKRK